jgi:hypothetical protein
MHYLSQDEWKMGMNTLSLRLEVGLTFLARSSASLQLVIIVTLFHCNVSASIGWQSTYVSVKQI